MAVTASKGVIMKKLLFSFTIIFAITNANADMGTGKYRDALKKCDKEQTQALDNQASTNDVKKTVLDTSNCYVKVGNAVIKKYYSDTIEDTGKKFISFANSIYASSLNLYSGPDECYPECGQISGTMRMNMTESYIKKYIVDMLDYIDTLDI
jgi:hypothetical protein